MLKQVLLAAFIAVSASAAHAQGVEILDEHGGRMVLTRTDVLELRQFDARLETEMQVILEACENDMYWRRGQKSWNPHRAERAIIDCARRGEREYVLNYRTPSPFLTALLAKGTR